MTTKRKRMPKGRVAALFLAGTPLLDICRLFNAQLYEVERALRQHMKRVMR